jgi:predicted phage terminase large subunit-like protein
MDENGNFDTEDIAGTCRDDFYFFCKILKPRFYLTHRWHLKKLCKTLQDFHEEKILNKNGEPITQLMINFPPRHGKTLTVDMFTQWILGLNPLSSVIRACYNEDLSGRSAKTVRDGIQEIKAGARIVYSDIFPDTKVKYGDSSYHLWSLEKSPFSFLATSPHGMITGVGCKWGIIDDLIKDAKEAYNDRILEEHFDWYHNTFMQRLESGAKKLIIAHRWAKNDLCGKLLATEEDEWHVIKMPAHIIDEEMLCPDILDYKEYTKRKEADGTDPLIFSANYDQEILENIDRLYGTFKTYDTIQEKYDRIEAYIDTADEGKDYLAGGVIGIHNGIGDMLDIIYTSEPMEYTENATARMLTNLKCDKAIIESNNGGRGFARAVEKLMREMGNTHTVVEWFHQGENKQARILSQSTAVTNCIIMPKKWQDIWTQFYYDIMHLSRGGKWARDDAPDFLSGVIEKILAPPQDFHIY